jgi:BASS family bile acid:Na+ symporter
MVEILRLVEKLSVFTFLVCSMLAMGLSLTLQAIFAPLRNFRLVLLTLALNFILAPGYAWLLTIVIPLQRGHAIGILLLGAAAGAPFLPTLAGAG